MSLVSTSISHSSTPQRKKKKDVPVTFSRCQVWKEEEGIKKEREEGDLRDLSMYALHNLFVLERLTEVALYQKHAVSFKSTNTILHAGASQYIWRFLEDSLRFLLSKKNWGSNDCNFTTVHYSRCVAKFVITWALWTFDYGHPADGVLCHFALIVSL